MATRNQLRHFTVTVENSFRDIVSGVSWKNPPTTQKYVGLAWTETTGRTGTDNPAHQYQIKRHIDATTGFSASRQTVDAQQGSATSTYEQLNGNILTTTKTTLNGYLGGTIETFSADAATMAKAASNARDRCFAKIRSQQTPASAGVFLGEIREVIHAIRNPAVGLSRLILGEQYTKTKRNLWAASRPNPSRKKRSPSKKEIKRSVSGAIADSWLENSFGWQPLINDVKSAAVALGKLNVDPEYVPLRTFGGAKGTPVIVRNGEWGLPGFISYDEILVKVSSAEKHYYGEIRNKLANQGGGLTHAVENLSRTASAFGLTKAEFIPTIWELIPFSFLVDYFSNVGDILNQSMVDLGAVVRLSSTSVSRGTTSAILGSFRGTVPTVSASGSMPAVITVDKLVNRTPGSDLTVAPLRFEFPAASSLKWANIAALITTHYTGMGQKLSKRY